MVLLHLPLIRSLLIPDAASGAYECSLTGPMPLQSVGQAAGKARGGDVLTPVPIRKLALVAVSGKGQLTTACAGSGSLVSM